MNQPSLEELLEAGAHFGHQVAKWHPRMKPYIYTERNTVHIIDLQQTQDKLKAAQEYVAGLVGNGGTVLFIGTKRQAQKAIKSVAGQVEMPYVNERWLGGTFTNFDTIKKQIAKLKELERKRDSGELDKYTKKEQVTFDKEIDRLSRFFGGLRSLNKLPEAIFVIDINEESSAVKEARRKGVKIVAVCDTNVDPGLVDYCIPCNDDAVKVIDLLIEAMGEAVAEGKKKVAATKQAQAEGKDIAKPEAEKISKESK
ncbi:30S ribosomal protein S2 [Patescibacteria group bacterium]